MEKINEYLKSLIDTTKNQDIIDILTLLNQNRYDDLKQYIENPYLYTPNKNYSYSARELIQNNLIAYRNFIKDLEIE